MLVSATNVISLARDCAPSVAPSTMLAVVMAESDLDPLAIFDNSSARRIFVHSLGDARATAKRLVAAGHSIDMGLAQINSGTAPRLGLSISDAFAPCRNIAAAAQLMTATYRRMAAAGASNRQHALARMLSAYNSGNATRGFRNGYVARVYRTAARIAFDLRSVERGLPFPSPTASYRATASALLPPSRGDARSFGFSAARPASASPSVWAAFGAQSAHLFVFDPSQQKGSVR